MGPGPVHPLKQVLEELTEISARIDRAEMDRFVTLLEGVRRIFVAGMGRSGLMARAMAMRLMHLGFDVHIVGDTTTPSIGAEDLLICCTRYGRSRTLRTFIVKAHEAGAVAAVITMMGDTPLAKQADHVFLIPVANGGKTRQPLGTAFEQALLLYCDGLVMLAMEHLGVDESQMARQHTQLE